MTALPLSEEMLADNRSDWDAMQRHRFVRDIEAGLLDREVFRRYLVYEGDFVATAIAIFAEAVAKAPGIAEQRWLIGVLRALADEQIGYFEATFAELEIEPASVPPHPAVAAFRDGMREIAREGGYLEIVTAMFCAEWMYWHWCRRAAGAPIIDRVLRRWVDLHAEDAFAAQALWLKQQVDQAGQHLGAEGRKALSALFGRVLRLEIDFHSAPYEGASGGPA